MSPIQSVSPLSTSLSVEPETRLNFTLKHWCLWQSTAKSDTQCWPGGEVLAFSENGPDVRFMPMLQRRRLSPLARAAFAVAWRCREKVGNIPTVFFSNHGESQEYFEMLESISRSESLSPSRFSLGVHNAIAGLFSIQCENVLPYVALAGGGEGLFAAFLETAGQLMESPQILAVCYDRPLPQLYQPYLATSETTWALGMILAQAGEVGQPLHLTRRSCSAPPNQPAIEPELIQAILNGQRHGQSHQERSVWSWNLGDA